MTIEIKAPTLPESVPDGTIATWYKKIGDPVAMDELLVDIETDKVVIEVVSPTDGTLKEILKNSGDTIVSNEAIGSVEPGDAPTVDDNLSDSSVDEHTEDSASPSLPESSDDRIISPAARKLIEENQLAVAAIAGTGKDSRITKEDVVNFITAPAPQQRPVTEVPGDPLTSSLERSNQERIEERVPMSRLRAKVAERMLQATQTTAMLTTFNEVSMQAVIGIRNRHKEEFEKTHDGVRLGFMSFFVRACTEALKKFPGVNASIDGDDIVYHGYQDIGVAVSSSRGLVVPVLRNADNKGLAHIEKEIRTFTEKAREGKLAIEDMTGGTFTISNGGSTSRNPKVGLL